MSKLILEGWVSVLAALQAQRRSIEAVYVQQGKDVRNLGQIERLAAEGGIALHAAPAAEIDALAQGSSHGGVLALAGERRFEPLETLAETPGWVVMLDGVEDPYNYGQAIRALYAAGANGLVAPLRNWDTALNVVARASAGASEHMPTARADVLEALAFFKGRGYRSLAAAKAAGSTPLYAAALGGPLFLLIGGERRGLNAAALAQCDRLISIPYGRDFKAELDVTSSTAAIAFEVMRQRAYT
ncbi:MAG: RNA methyltransferase [Anaerolineales bacterium]|nr:MAG: RNA methyltransferase [Anaerolineales bacterium]